MEKITHPYYPIIYVRGYAMTQGEIAGTVATPYMGFNLGSTKIRQSWEGKPQRHIFESPLVRLMKDYCYKDIYEDGTELPGKVSSRSIVVYRYYERADKDLGTGEVPSVESSAKGLRELIHRLKRQVCGDDPVELAKFKVYLVAHSMGGLVCRCFLQNDNVSNPADRALVDKVFTYATPHNGIDMAGINVPSFLGLWDMNNFNRGVMAKYLGFDGDVSRVDSLNGKFDPERFFCLVGTNPKDYDVAGGLSSKLAGEMSDGLVQIENAAVRGAPRAFVYRSHSGPYGIVNSEEGYQNLVRFLFGNVGVKGTLEVENLPLPPSVKKAYQDDQKVLASYYFEAAASPRGASSYLLTERRKNTFSAIFRQFDEMLKLSSTDLARPRWPVLFSVFLDKNLATRGRTLVFGLDLAVSTTGYTVENQLWFDRHIPGEYLFRDTVSIRATQKDDGWSIRYNLTGESWGESRGRSIEQDAQGPYIPLESRKGFRGKLRLRFSGWE